MDKFNIVNIYLYYIEFISSIYNIRLIDINNIRLIIKFNGNPFY